MATRKQRDQNLVQHRALAHNDLANLRENLIPRQAKLRNGLIVGVQNRRRNGRHRRRGWG